MSRPTRGSSASAHCPVARYVLMTAPPTRPSPRAVIDVSRRQCDQSYSPPSHSGTCWSCRSRMRCKQTDAKMSPAASVENAGRLARASCKNCSGKWLSALPRYACSHQPTIRPSARNNLVADGSRSRLSRWLTSRWVGSRFQRSLHGHAVQGNIWSMSKVFRLRGRSVQAQCRLPASTTLSATCRARDTSRAGSDQRIAANIFVSARGRFCPLAYSRISLIHSAISVGSIQATFRRIERQRWPGTRIQPKAVK